MTGVKIVARKAGLCLDESIDAKIRSGHVVIRGSCWKDRQEALLANRLWVF